MPDTVAEVQAAEARFPDAPVEADKAWIEMVHRYFATALGALILGMVIVAFRIPNGVPGGVPRALPAALLALVVLQGAFGAWTVTLKLWPQVVTAHLLGGFATLALLWLLALRLGIGPKEKGNGAVWALGDGCLGRGGGAGRAWRLGHLELRRPGLPGLPHLSRRLGAGHGLSARI